MVLAEGDLSHEKNPLSNDLNHFDVKPGTGRMYTLSN